MMNKRRFEKYQCRKGNLFCTIEEDLVGWYLYIDEDPESKIPTRDYLLDSLEEAFDEAESQFDIPKTSWKNLK